LKKKYNMKKTRKKIRKKNKREILGLKYPTSHWVEGVDGMREDGTRYLVKHKNGKLFSSYF